MKTEREMNKMDGGMVKRYMYTDPIGEIRRDPNKLTMALHEGQEGCNVMLDDQMNAIMKNGDVARERPYWNYIDPSKRRKDNDYTDTNKTNPEWDAYALMTKEQRAELYD